MKEDCDLLVRTERLVKTEENNYESLKNKITQRIQSNFLDWDFNRESYSRVPSANLGQFVGSTVNDEVIRLIKRNILSAFIAEDLIDPEAVFIEAIPIDPENIIFYVSLNVQSAFEEVSLGLTVMYNTRQNITTSKIEEIREESWS